LTLVIAVAAAVTLVLAMIAVGATQGWWFLQSGGAPKPLGSVDVVKTGSWNGHQWALTAYRSGTDGICFAITPGGGANSTGVGAGMACDQITGVALTPETKPSSPHGITFLSGCQPNLANYIVGPVVNSALQVEITLTDGTVIRTPTFPAPADLGDIRFYATPLQGSCAKGDTNPSELLDLDQNGQIVARLNLPAPRP
jgi:hypothetical protein